LPTVTGERWGAVDGFAVLLYPFIDGKSGMTVGLSDRQWFEFGRVLKRIHDSQLPPELFAQMRKETFVPHPKLTGIVRQLQATIQTSACTNPVERQLAIFWEDHHSDIGKIVDRAEQLGRLLQRQSLDCVLCHADIHTGNLLLEPGGALHVVDWDQPILAPKERDLLFAMDEAVGGFGNGHAEELFYLGYGKTEIDRLALAYYRYEWVVQDMGAFAEHVLLMDDTGDEGKQESVDLFMSMFEPGNRVEAAYQLDRTLSIS
jgi:spectinomycin phosphotransferase